MAVDSGVGEEKYIMVLGLIRKAFQQNELLVAQHDYPADKIEVLAQETTKKLLGVFDRTPEQKYNAAVAMGFALELLQGE